MPKVSKVKKFRSKAITASTSNNNVSPIIQETNPSPPVKENTLDRTVTYTHDNSNETKIQSDYNNDSTDNNINTNNQLSRGQRKRQAKREQYLRKEQMVLSTLRLKRLEEQKGRLDGLDAIKEALVASMNSTSGTTNTNNNHDMEHTTNNNHNNNTNTNSITNKSKMNIAQKELNHFSLILQHPSFQSNPFATMQEHLKNTFAQDAQEQTVIATQQQMEYSKQMAERKEARKERIREYKYQKGRRGFRRKK